MPNDNQMIPNQTPLMQNQPPLQNMSDQNMQDMYPDLYKMIAPYVQKYAEQLQGKNITDDMIDSIVEEIMMDNGMSDEDEYDMQIEAENSIATQFPIGYGNPYPSPRPYPYQTHRRRRHRRYPRYYVSPLDDLFRLILLQQLGGYYYRY